MSIELEALLLFVVLVSPILFMVLLEIVDPCDCGW